MPSFPVSDDLSIDTSIEQTDDSRYVHYVIKEESRVMGVITIRYGVFTYHQNNPPHKQYQMTTMDEEHWEMKFDTQTPAEYWHEKGPTLQTWFEGVRMPNHDYDMFNEYIAKTMLFQRHPATINWIEAERWFQ
tara:strand:- start:323 stop:721 length:399 start_codon:yes stop_codon:yes gene_type:complete